MSLKLLKQSIQISLAKMQANQIKQNETIGNDAYDPNVEISLTKYPNKYNNSERKLAANPRRRFRVERKGKGKDNDKTERNVKSLLKMSNSTEVIKDAEKIVEHAYSGRYENIKTTPAAITQSIFTEEDFRAFEEEYVKSLH